MSSLFGKRPRTPKRNPHHHDNCNDRRKRNSTIAAATERNSVGTNFTLDDKIDVSTDRCNNDTEENGRHLVEAFTASTTSTAEPVTDSNTADNSNISVGDEYATATTKPASKTKPSLAAATFADLGLAESLVHVCQKILSYKQPTPVQKTMIPYLLLQSPSQQQRHHNCFGSGCVTAATGSGKTASYLLPIIHNCMIDPTTIFAIVLAPTRELATQIHQQCVLFTTSTSHNTTMISSKCVVGGCDIVAQGNMLYNTPPHIVITTPGRFATILQNPSPPRNLHKISYCIIDEADRIFPSTISGSSSKSQCGFTSDMEIILQHIYCPNTSKTCITPTTTNANHTQQQLLRQKPRLLFYSATCTSPNYKMYQQIVSQYLYETTEAGAEITVPLPQFIISEDFTVHDKGNNGKNPLHDDNKNDTHDGIGTETALTQSPACTTNTTTITTNIPNGLKQEYIFMPSQVRDAYLIGSIRTLLAYGGTKVKVQPSAKDSNTRKHLTHSKHKQQNTDKYDDIIEQCKAQSAILFVSTCERAALISELLKQVGVPNVALHSLVSTQQSVRNKVLHQFQSEYVRVIVATDIASRGLDLPRTDLVINVELSNITPMTYIHRIGRTARAGRRGRAISFVTEHDVVKVQNIERAIGITLQSCTDMTDEIAMSMLSITVKATRLAKLQLEQMNFHELLNKMKQRKLRDQQDRKQRQQQN
jgi:ATP-dependent RNA helicase DDX49/DBP8